MKQAKIAIIVIGLLVGGFFIFRSLSNRGPSLDGRIEMVDITTGQIIRADRRTIPGFPALNGDRKAVVLPIERRDGQVYIRSGLENLVNDIIARDSLSPTDVVVDLETYSVRTRR
ncbi:MAG: hypothetical protein ACNA8P_10625 [Phycisphaerales bacterium]